MVERHHELFRQLVHNTRSQLEEEDIYPDNQDAYAEREFIKNAMLSVGGVAPMQAVYGVGPPLRGSRERVRCAIGRQPWRFSACTSSA